MSLDISLKIKKSEKSICHQCGSEYQDWDYLYDANITHNLGSMAGAAGIYEALWRPEEIGAEKARDIIPILTVGLRKLENNPAQYEKYNAPNGWGMYEHFVPFVRNYLKACKENPEAIISVSR